MINKMKLIGRIGAIFSFIACLTGGLWILTSVGFEHGDINYIWTGLGLYFVGKAFFVGPLLLLIAEQFKPGTETEG